MKSLRLLTSAVSALLLVGCGSGDSGTDAGAERTQASDTSSVAPSDSGAPSESVAPNPEDAEAALRAWIQAYVDGNAETACSLQTNAYTEHDLDASIRQGTLQPGDDCEDGVRLALQMVESMGVDLSMRKVELRSHSGDEATFRVTYDYGGSGMFRMALQDGKWLVDGELTR